MVFSPRGTGITAGWLRYAAATVAEDHGVVMQTACVVVGAGAAGLAVSRELADRGVGHIVLERGEVGSTWAEQRWDSFRLNTPGWMNGTLGDVEPQSFCTRDQVVNLLAQAASALPVHTQSPVESLTISSSGFLLRTPAEELRASCVVLASGLLNVPRKSDVAARLPRRLMQLHASDYRSPEQLPPGAVLVIGGGQSGCQIAEDLAQSGRDVYLSTSRVGRYAWKYRGRETIGWLVDAGFWDQRPADLDDPAVMRAAQPIVASGGRDLSLALLAGMGVTLLGRIESVAGEEVLLDDSVPANAASGTSSGTACES
jgi:putative flavoprotein involved in K+ transport